MMAQSEGERRKANREEKARSRRRKRVNDYWRERFSGDIDVARKLLAADDVLAEEFLTQFGDYPWKAYDDNGILYPVDGDALWSLPPDGASINRLSDEHFADTHEQDDIDEALVNGWHDMRVKACNDLAQVKRELRRASDPDVPKHDPKRCGRCGLKTKH